jgi:hypothetical protein
VCARRSRLSQQANPWQPGFLQRFARKLPSEPPLTTQEEYRQFHQDGYLLLDLELPPDVLDAASARVAQLCQDGRGVLDAWQSSPEIKAVALAPRTLATLHDLYSREPLPFRTCNSAVGTEQPTHSDTIYFNTIPPGYMCAVWVPLEDVDLMNGPLVFYPGSHKLPPYDLGSLGLIAHVDHRSYYDRYIAGQIECANLKPRYATLRKGQALILAANLLHGGLPPKDRTRSRLSQETHYFFEKCRYYTPLFSESNRAYWDDPQWIR